MGDETDRLFEWAILDGTYDDREHFAIRCKYCGQDGFEWDQWNGKWRLYDREGHLHVCEKYEAIK